MPMHLIPRHTASGAASRYRNWNIVPLNVTGIDGAAVVTNCWLGCAHRFVHTFCAEYVQ